MPTFDPAPFDPTKPESKPTSPSTADQRAQHVAGNQSLTDAYADVAALEAGKADSADLAAHEAETSGGAPDPHGSGAYADAVGAGAQAALDTHKTSADHDARYLQTVNQDPAPVLGGNLQTKGSEVRFTRGDDSLQGGAAALDTALGVAMFYEDTPGEFDLGDGAVHVGPGHVDLHGTVARVLGMAHVEDTRQSVYVDRDGGLYAIEEVVGWTVEDTDSADYNLGAPGTGTGTWFNLSGLAIATQGDVDTGERIDVSVSLYTVNKTSNRTGVLEIYYSIDGAVPGALDVDDSAPVAQGFAGMLTLGGTYTAPAPLAAGTTISIYARAASGSGNGFGLDLVGILGPHRILVSVPRSGGGGTGGGIGKGTPFVAGDLMAAETTAGDGTAETVGFAPADVARRDENNTHGPRAGVVSELLHSTDNVSSIALRSDAPPSGSRIAGQTINSTDGHYQLARYSDGGVPQTQFEIGPGGEVRTLRTLALPVESGGLNAAALYIDGVPVSTGGGGGGLTPVAEPGDSNVTGTVGRLSVIDMSTFTANRDYTLPATFAVGDEVGVYVSRGSATHLLRILTAAGDLVGGIDYSSTPFDYLLAAEESQTFLGMVQDTEWALFPKMRKPQSVKIKIDPTSSGGTWPSGSWTTIPFNVTEYDATGGCVASDGSGQYIVVRRPGNYIFQQFIGAVDAAASTTYYQGFRDSTQNFAGHLLGTWALPLTGTVSPRYGAAFPQLFDPFVTDPGVRPAALQSSGNTLNFDVNCRFVMLEDV